MAEAGGVQRRSVRTRHRNRRRLAVTVAVVVALVVAGVGLARRGGIATATSPRSVAVTEPSTLLHTTWYLQSWTAADGSRVLPDTDRPPTVVFDSRTHAHSDDPTNTTQWSITLGRGTLSGAEEDTTAVAENEATQAANAAMATVLKGPATWRVTGSTLTVRLAGRASLTYTRDASIALGVGGLNVAILARGYQPYAIGGTVIVTGPGGRWSRAVGTESQHLSRLVPGAYRITATVVGGTCTPKTATVVGGSSVYVDVPCLVAAAPASRTADLVGRTWYLRSITFHGHTFPPATARPASLVFESRTKATTDDGSTTTSWRTTFAGAYVSWQDRSVGTSNEDRPSFIVGADTHWVLQQATTYSVIGGVLTLRASPSSSLTYTLDKPRPVTLGRLAVVLTEAAGGVPAAVGGTVTVQDVTGLQVIEQSARAAGLRTPGLPPGSYVVSGQTLHGYCAYRNVVVTGGRVTSVRLRCSSRH